MSGAVTLHFTNVWGWRLSTCQLFTALTAAKWRGQWLIWDQNKPTI